MSSRFQAGEGVTGKGQGQDRDKTGTRQGQDRDKTGTIQRQDRDKKREAGG